MRSMLSLLLATTLTAAPAWALDYDEAVHGEIGSDENNPMYLGMLSAGVNVIRGTVDPTQDSFTLDIPPNAGVTAARIEITGYQSLGQDGYVRFFRSPPFEVAGEQTITGDGLYNLDISAIGAWDPISFSTSSVGPSGAVYNFRLVIEVASTCTPIGGLLWDEGMNGELGSDENNPQFIGDLAPGNYTMCGEVDPIQDSVTFGLPYGRTLTTADVYISRFESFGQDGYVRWFNPSPFGLYGDQFFAGQAVFPLNPVGAAGAPIIGFSAASVGPFGASYDWILDFTVERGPELRTSLPPIAGSAATFRVDRLAPGDRATLVASTRLGTTPIPLCPGLSAEVRAPTVLGTRTADAAGAASFTVNLPANFAGRTVYLQALDQTTCTITPVAAYSL